MARKSTGVYPPDWPQIALAVKSAASWRCVRCNHKHAPDEGYCLTVHHLDLNPANSAWWNLLPLCQRCHLSIQGRVDLARPWVMTEHSEWFKPYVAGWYAFRYQGRVLSRDEVMMELDALLQLERTAILGSGAC